MVSLADAYLWKQLYQQYHQSIFSTLSPNSQYTESSALPSDDDDESVCWKDELRKRMVVFIVLVSFPISPYILPSPLLYFHLLDQDYQPRFHGQDKQSGYPLFRFINLLSNILSRCVMIQREAPVRDLYMKLLDIFNADPAWPRCVFNIILQIAFV